MLRRTLHIAGLAGVLSLVPVSFHTHERGRLPLPAVSDLACEETGECCAEPGSICLESGETKIDHREAKAGTCR
jgi:hypothetical protein